MEAYCEANYTVFVAARSSAFEIGALIDASDLGYTVGFEHPIAVSTEVALHDRPVEFFGGEKGFQDNRRRDAKKRDACTRAGITIIEVRPGYKLNDVTAAVRTNRSPRQPGSPRC
jgi:hypothetical protein